MCLEAPLFFSFWWTWLHKVQVMALNSAKRHYSSYAWNCEKTGIAFFFGLVTVLHFQFIYKGVKGNISTRIA